MAKEFAAAFYKSIAWQNCRNAYVKSVGGLCEECLKRGEYVPGEIVHHIRPITSANVNDPSITLNWKNLKLVCRECHAKEHGARQRRYQIDKAGRVTAKRSNKDRRSFN